MTSPSHAVDVESTSNPAGSGTHSFVLLASSALCSAGAAALHFAVVPHHLAEFAPFGAFFLMVGIGQLALALLLVLRPSRLLFKVGLFSSVGLLALWLVSRTTGLPIGPDPWVPEQAGVTDVLCVALEVAGLLLFAALMLRRPRPHTRRPVRTALALAPVALVVAALSYVGAGTGLAAMPVAVNATPASAGAQSVPVSRLVAEPGPQPLRSFTMVAQQAVIDGKPAFTFNGTVPGPVLHVTQGDRVRVTLLNHLPVATTIHWHGLRLPNAEDGVAGITQDAVGPGQSFTYEFVATDAGTYWYHSHQETGSQIPAGLFGALVVQPPAGRVAEEVDYPVVLHTMAGQRTIAVNGTTGDLRLAARPGQTVRLRIIDAVAPDMDGTAEAPVLLGAPYQIAALDGHDLAGPQQLGPQRIALGMGQRADLIFTMPATGAVRLVDTQLRGQPSALERLFPPPSAAETVTLGSGDEPTGAKAGLLPIFDATHYGTATPDPLATTPGPTYPVVLAQGPGFHAGAVQLVHTINGAASPDVPPIIVHTGQTVRLHLVNDTAEYHPMHLHGHVFDVLAVDGRLLHGSPVHQDTVLVAPHQSVDVAFLADNPGIWMLHCHVLLHAAMGMSMTIDYAGVRTPYEMGSRSGNIPE